MENIQTFAFYPRREAFPPTATSQTPSADPASSTAVSWQTIFWTLIALGISSMSQPGGRVCGLPLRYRTYLRCSPMLCLADSISILAQLIISLAFAKLSIKEAIGFVLHGKFKPEPLAAMAPEEDIEEESSRGIQTLEGMTGLRWAFFVLGTLPQAVKLLAIQGIGWTKAWAIMFLISWFLNEILVIIASLNRTSFTISPGGGISWPGYERLMHSSPHAWVLRRTKQGNKVLAMVALVAHVVLMNGIFRALWRRSFIDRSRQYRMLDGSVIEMDYWYWSAYSSPSSGISLVMAAAVASMMLLPGRYLRSRTAFAVYSSRTWVETYGTWLWICLPFIMVMVILDGLLYGRYYPADITWVLGSAVAMFLLSMVVAGLFVGLIHLGSSISASIGRNLLVLHRSRVTGKLKVDYIACLVLIYFLFTLASTLFAYCYLCDLRETVAPSWTGVFG